MLQKSIIIEEPLTLDWSLIELLIERRQNVTLVEIIIHHIASIRRGETTLSVG